VEIEDKEVYVFIFAFIFSLALIFGLSLYGIKYGFGPQCEKEGFVEGTNEFTEC